MKLDVTLLRYLAKEDFRTLTAIELGMKNHELVPTPLIFSIAKLKHGGAKKCIGVLHKHKLVWHDSKKYDGYKLTYSGYDYLALKTMSARGSLVGIGKKLGVGKESDIYIAVDANGREMALKLHRLGRVSFRSIKNNRDYLQHRKSASWLYLSRLASLKEFAFMKALREHGFPVPEPIDCNRHCVLMSLIPGYLMAGVKKLKHPGKVYSELMNLIIRLAQYGLIHCDFNEFNIMINDEEEITLIDFPQMVSTSHPNAEMYFNRDVQCIRTFFSKKFGFEGGEWPRFQFDTEKQYSLDIEVAASGFTKDDQAQYEKLINELEVEEDSENEEVEESDSDESVESSDDDEHGFRKEIVDSDGEEEVKVEEPEKEDVESESGLVFVEESGPRKREKNIVMLVDNVENLKLEDNASEEIVEQTNGENVEEAQEEEEEEIDTEYIKQRVRKSLKNRHRPSVKRNTEKLRSKRDNSQAIKSAF